MTIIFQQQEPNPNTIVAIPAGLKSEDPVLPGMSFGWEDAIFSEMLRRCNEQYTPQLLKYIEWARANKVLCFGGYYRGSSEVL